MMAVCYMMEARVLSGSSVFLFKNSKRWEFDSGMKGLFDRTKEIGACVRHRPIKTSG